VSVVGIGVDVVELARFSAVLERTPRVAERLFTPAERELPVRSLAARFATKEAVAKALGAPRGLAWHDVEVVKADDGRPWLSVTGTVAAAAEERGVRSWHLSLSHDGPVAIAMVIAES
jgi:holo-[acyl-carrier protein] synthase